MGSDIVYPLVLERNFGLFSYGFTGKLGDYVVTEVRTAHGHALEVCMPQGRHVGVGRASEYLKYLVGVDLIVEFIDLPSTFDGLASVKFVHVSPAFILEIFKSSYVSHVAVTSIQ